MGTRADFYIGRGKSAEWLGSIAWDGYPRGISDEILKASDVDGFRKAVSEFLEERDDATTPEQGWPWPWENSQTTDYAYAFDGGSVWGSSFGYSWWSAANGQPAEEEEPGEKVEFPDMSTDAAAQAGSERSGVMVFTSRKY